MSHPVPEFPPLTDHDRRLIVNALFIAGGQFGATKVEPGSGIWTAEYNKLAQKLGYPGPGWNVPDDRPKCAHGCRPAFLDRQRAQSCWKCAVEIAEEKTGEAIRDREHWALQYVEMKNERERDSARCAELQTKLEIAAKSLAKRFFDGVREGVRRYAWWKDGVQQVGTCGTTLEKALQAIDTEEKDAPTTC